MSAPKTYPEPQIGYWYTSLLIEELRQIEDEQDLADVIKEIALLREDGVIAHVFKTKEAALKELRY